MTFWGFVFLRTLYTHSHCIWHSNTVSVFYSLYHLHGLFISASANWKFGDFSVPKQRQMLFMFIFSQTMSMSELWAKQFVWVEVCVLTLRVNAVRWISAYSAGCDLQWSLQMNLKQVQVLWTFENFLKLFYDPKLDFCGWIIFWMAVVTILFLKLQSLSVKRKNDPNLRRSLGIGRKPSFTQSLLEDTIFRTGLMLYIWLCVCST